MPPKAVSERREEELAILLQLPATRWDRLVAVLEASEPERAIDAPHILERAKKLHMTDMDLFYLLLLHYQDNMSTILLDVLSMYAMMTTWIDWIKQVQRCFDVKKGKIDVASSRPRTATQTDFQLTSRSGSNAGGSQYSSPVTADSSSTTASDSANNIDATHIHMNPSVRDSGVRNGRSRGHSNMRAHRGKAGRSGFTGSIHCNFDLGPDWEWDGSLDFLRDGHVLSNLVEEALEHCGKLGDLQDDHRVHPDVLNRGTFDVLYPSLADIDRMSKEHASGSVGGNGDAMRAETAATFDPVTYLSTFDRSRLSRDCRGKVPASKALKLIEQQGRNLAAAEHWVTRLNGMCEHFLCWKKSTHNGELFMDISNSDTLVRPLNADDKRLLYRLHWLAVALYRTVKDPSIIPAPPRMSFIVCSGDFTGVLDTSEEDNEIGLLVATKCSCLPITTKLVVTMKNFNTIQLKHPRMAPGQEALPCTLVRGETYVYYLDHKVFMPIWCVLQYYIKKYDDIPWRFELNRQERDREAQVLGSNSSNPRPSFISASSSDFGASGSGAMFDLTVQSSTVRRGRDKKTEVSTAGRRVRPSIALPMSVSEAIAQPEQRRSTSGSPNSSSRRGQAVTKNVAFATVRRNRVTAAAPSPNHSVTGLLPLSTPLPSRPPLPPQLPSSPVAAAAATGATPTVTGPATTIPESLTMRMQQEASMAETVEAVNESDVNKEGASPTSDSLNDLASNAITNPSSIASSVTSNDPRQVTAFPSTMKGSAQTSTAATANGTAAATGEGDLDYSASNYRRSAPHNADSVEETEAPVEHDTVVEATAVITPSRTTSCPPSSQAMVCRESFNSGNAELEDADDGDEDEATMDTSMMMYSESHKMLRNFTASVVQESELNGIAILSHHFRVSGGPIGKGAFGAVYKALNLDTGRIVAVKQSRVSYDDRTNDLNWREFQTWSRLPLHANVIVFYGASKEVDTHQLLLVMEYASGGSIVQLYRHFRPIPEPLFYDHACGMARGIKHLHDHNVIHGDVKPENVLTRSDGSVAITDFGCSRCSITNSDSDSLMLRSAQKDSSSWQLFGTAAYMAPEVILNEPHFKSDVWAYACTLLQLWLGKAPWSGGERRFSAQDSIPLMFYIANEEAVPYTQEQLEHTPRWLQRIAQRAFEREVDKRCTMGEIIGILNEYSRAYAP